MDNHKTKPENKAAFPCVDENYIQEGMTKLEVFTLHAMQGICVNANRNGFSYGDPEHIARESVLIAKSVLTELNKNN